jgi:hypothetical protein
METIMNATNSYGSALAIFLITLVSATIEMPGAIRTTVGLRPEIPGTELLTNGEFASGTASWNTWAFESAEAVFSVTPDFNGAPALRIQVSKPGAVDWDVQINQAGLSIMADQYYTLSFWARASQPTRAIASVMEAHDPWWPLGYWDHVNLENDWRQFSVVFAASGTDANARVNFEGICSQPVIVWLAKVSLKRGGGPPLSLTTSRLPSSTVSVAYRQSLVATGGARPYYWSLAGGALPMGLVLTTNGLISGTPVAPGTAHFQVLVRDVDNSSALVDLAISVNLPGTQCYLGAVPIDGQEVFEGLAGKAIAFEHFYFNWGHQADFPEESMNGSLAGGAIPLLSWEPWDYTLTNANFTLQSIIEGRHDNYIRRWASQIQAWGRPIFLRWGHEMNGSWYPWDGVHNGGETTTEFGDPAKADGPERYVAAFRHIHALFQEAGADNVRWVWCPNMENWSEYPAGLPGTWNLAANYYPGDDCVDWLSLDAYNPGTSQPGFKWASFDALMQATYDDLTALNADKPVMIAEFASAEVGGDKAAWIADAYRQIKTRYSRVKAACWFHVNKETNWRIDSSPSTLAAFKLAISDPYFLPGFFLIGTGQLPIAHVGDPYECALAAKNDIAPTSWSLAEGSLPGGLSLSSAGVISGTPAALGSSRFAVQVKDARNEIIKKNFNLVVQAALPSSWQDADIGALELPGEVTWQGGTFTARASGTDIWDTQDAFHFLYQPWNGDGEFVARVDQLEPTDGWAKAGIMLRQSLTPGSPHAMMVITPQNGAAFQWRAAANGSSDSRQGQSGLNPPTWLKLKRQGNVFSGYQSADGNTWTPIGSVALSLPSAIYTGFCLTSHNNNLRTRAVFSVTAVDTRRSPAINWNPPASIVVGTPLGAAQLNAIASVPGTFVYQPPLGTTLSLGLGQVLTAIFVPADTGNYLTVTNQTEIDVVAPPLMIITDALSAGRQGARYTAELSAQGGVGPYLWSLASGTLPAGLQLSGDGIIAGVPRDSGSSSFQVQTRDAQNAVAVKDLTLVIQASSSGTELLQNGDFTSGFDYWVTGSYGSAVAVYQITNAWDGKNAAMIQVVKPGIEAWNVQFNQPNLTITQGKNYTFSFWAKGSQTAAVNAAVMQAHDPWSGLGYGLTLNITPNWQQYTTVFLASGSDTNARVNFEGFSSKPISLWLADISLKAGGIMPWTLGPWGVPGRIEAENFDTQGSGISYADTSPSNEGGAYRNESVDIQYCEDTGGGYNVGWIQNGEWLNYTVEVQTAGLYDLTFRVAGTSAGKIRILLAGKTLGTISIPSTGGWQAWRDVVARSLFFSAGTQVLKWEFVTGGFNLNYVDARLVPVTTPPELGIARSEPGVTALTLRLTGDPRRTYAVETSTDLRSWSLMVQVTADDRGQAEYRWLNYVQASQQFVRARPWE